MTPESLMAKCAASGVQHDRVRSDVAPEWSWEDACLACAGLPDAQFSAFAYRYAQNDSVRPKLRMYLFFAASGMAERERWPTVPLDALVDLVLYEEWVQSRMPRLWQQLKVADLWATLLGVDSKLWERRLRFRYEGIRQIIERWCGEAHTHAARRIHEDVDAVQEVA